MKRILVFICLAALTGCSVRRMAVNKIGDAIASGGSTYEKDDDLELVESALPFSLKLLESLLAEAPRHRGLLQSSCQGFATYAYLHVQQEADRIAGQDVDAAQAMRARARRLYLRASEYGFRGLEVAAPGIAARFTADPRAAVAQLRKRKDVPLLYWNAAALGLAIGVSKNDARMLARIPEVEALLDRALALDETWDSGALHEFSVTFGGAKPGRADYTAIARHYARAQELAAGRRASVHLAYAEAYCVAKQDAACFKSALEKALAVDPYAQEAGRLQNVLAQRRARMLLERVDELILPQGDL